MVFSLAKFFIWRMTKSFSDEKHSWNNHEIQIIKNNQVENKGILDGITNGTEICLAHENDDENSYFNYKHYFITDVNRQYLIEFEKTFQTEYQAEVKIKRHNDKEMKKIDGFKIEVSKPMDEGVRKRTIQLLGMNNYSICLRNSEHVANYIFRGSWISSQTDPETGSLMKHFKKYMDNDQLKLINTLPRTDLNTCNELSSKKLYSFLEGYYKVSSIDYFLDYKEDTYNILIIGPTGAGKSHFINVIFNEFICSTDVSHSSVTRDICFIRGRGNVFDIEEKRFIERDIVVAETMGLCDTEWNDEEILTIIKGKVAANFKKIDTVFVIFRADRLRPDHVFNIKNVLNWLKFEKMFSRFQFVGTCAENLSCEKKAKLCHEAQTIFELEHLPNEQVCERTKEKYNLILYTGFPFEGILNDMSKERVIQSFNSLKYLLTQPASSGPITLT